MGVKYLLFEYDHGGPNNIIIAFKFILFLAALTKRTLVIPKAQPIFHFDWGPNSINESTTDFNKVSETHLNDIINLNAFSHLVKMISFKDFVKKEKKSLNLPENFAKFDRIFSDYKTMKIQSFRLKRKETKPYVRANWWNKRRKFMESKGFDNKVLRKQDWVYYSKLNFKTLSIKNCDLFIKTLETTKDKVVFLPMDTEFGTDKYKYYRIFGYAETMLTHPNPYWKKILNVRYLHTSFYDCVKKIKTDYLKGESYDAYHHRFNGFNFANNKINMNELVKLLESKIKNKILYIASDSYHMFAEYKNTNEIPFKIMSINEIGLEKYNYNKKYKSFIEMIICVNANIFIGTKMSTFTTEIINMRTCSNYHYKNLDKIKSNTNFVI